MKAKVLSEFELAAVLDRADAQEAVMLLASHRAGLRAMEVAALDWRMIRDATGGLAESIDLPAIATKGRTGAGRIPMAPDLRRALLRLSAMRRHPRRGRVILGPNGSGITAHAVVKRLGRLYQAAGLDGCSSHSGRRTFATRLASELPLPALQAAMRHARPSTTLGYIDAASDDATAAAIRALGTV